MRHREKEGGRGTNGSPSRGDAARGHPNSMGCRTRRTSIRFAKTNGRVPLNAHCLQERLDGERPVGVARTSLLPRPRRPRMYVTPTHTMHTRVHQQQDQCSQQDQPSPASDIYNASQIPHMHNTTQQNTTHNATPKFHIQHFLLLTHAHSPPLSLTHNNSHSSYIQVGRAKKRKGGAHWPIWTLFVAAADIAMMIVVLVKNGGFESFGTNPWGGPAKHILLDYGAKYAPYIRDCPGQCYHAVYYDHCGGDWWRLVSAIFLHIGIAQLILNLLILLRVASYPSSRSFLFLTPIFFFFEKSRLDGHWKGNMVCSALPLSFCFLV